MKTIREIEQYFETCKRYWMRQNIPEGVATVRALWWDCVEVWNADKSWTKEKEEFVRRYRQYTPYDPIPDEEHVREGNA